jgi:hypothetical protein
MNSKHLSKILVPALFVGILILDACKKDKNEPGQTEQEAVIRPVTGQSSAYVTQLFSYNPAPGQQINKSIGINDAAKTVLNGKAGLVTLGAFGGNIVLGFDHTVLNQANTEDIIIYNNAFSGFAEPGVVWVMQDTNNNGKPDDTWYELSGSAQNQAVYTRNYAITYTRPATITDDVAWTDNKGGSGVVKHNIFNTQAYYPEWITANTYTLTGTLLPTTNINDSNPSFVTSASFSFGYADNAPGSDKLDIGKAIDEKGNKVNLKGIDFIKIQTGIPYNLGSLGELSTEIKGVADISIGGI